MHSAVLRRALATSLAAGLGLVATTASATPSLELTSTVGRLSHGTGATELLVEVRNPDRAPVHGTIEVRRDDGRASVLAARAPFDVPAGGRRHVRMPVASAASRFVVSALDDAGGVLARTSDERADRPEHAIFAISPSDDERLQDLKSNVVHGSENEKSNETVSLGHAAVDTATGAPILTERAVVYEGISLVVAPARVLARIAPAEREALLGWVRTGGALALGIADARELAGLEELVGAGVRIVRTEDDSGYATPFEQKLVSYEGGRVTVGPFGGVARLGLGKVHLLAIDPWSPDANGNAWVQERIAQIAATSPSHLRPYADAGTAQAVTYLDPNAGYRSVIVVVGLVLAAHAIVTALGFRRIALRRGMGPAFRFAAATSAASFAAVVGLGIHARGGLAARSRELAFVEVASGERLAWVQRTRAFYTSDTRLVDVTPRDARNLLTPLGHGGPEPGVRVDGSDVASLVGVQLRPWQTVAVLERGTTTLPGTVTLRRDGPTFLVRNELGQPLRNVLVKDRGRGCLAFGDIPAGVEVDAVNARPSTACSMAGQDGKPWLPFDAMSGAPDDVFGDQLTLLGEIDPRGAAPDDGGMPVDRRTMVVRVAGGAS